MCSSGEGVELMRLRMVRGIMCAGCGGKREAAPM